MEEEKKYEDQSQQQEDLTENQETTEIDQMKIQKLMRMKSKNSKRKLKV